MGERWPEDKGFERLINGFRAEIEQQVIQLLLVALQRFGYGVWEHRFAMPRPDGAAGLGVSFLIMAVVEGLEQARERVDAFDTKFLHGLGAGLKIVGAELADEALGFGCGLAREVCRGIK